MNKSNNLLLALIMSAGCLVGLALIVVVVAVALFWYLSFANPNTTADYSPTDSIKLQSPNSYYVGSQPVSFV